MKVQLLNEQDSPAIARLLVQLNDNLSIDTIDERVKAMMQQMHYQFFGILSDKQELVAVGGVRLDITVPDGKVAHLENIVVHKDHRGEQLGNLLIRHFRQWGLDNECTCLELDSYVTAEKAHKFYFRENFRIRGLHFHQSLN